MIPRVLACALAALTLSSLAWAEPHASDHSPLRRPAAASSSMGARQAVALQGRVIRRLRFDRPGAKRGRFAIYLPPTYDVLPQKRYPVLYLLHGLGGRGEDWINSGALIESVHDALTSGDAGEFIVVMPDGKNGYWTNWTDGTEHYEDLVARDLVRHIDRSYRTVATREARWIAGLSMGGFGALSIALQNADAFSLAGSFSGAIFESAPSHRKVYKKVWGNPPDEAAFRRVSPLHLVERDGAKGLRIYLSCGDSDRLKFLRPALRLFRALDDRGADYELRVLDGGHAWSVWQPALRDFLKTVGMHAQEHGLRPTEDE